MEAINGFSWFVGVFFLINWMGATELNRTGWAHFDLAIAVVCLIIGFGLSIRESMHDEKTRQ